MTQTFRTISYLSEEISWQPRLIRPVTAGILDPELDLEKPILETLNLVCQCDTNLVKMLREPRRAFPNIGAQPPPDNRPGKGY